MKIGVKTFDDPEFLKHFKNKADFFEIMAIQKNNYYFLKEFSLPIIIHAEHQTFGVNNAKNIDTNKKSVDFAIKIADSNKTEKIIIHPGRLEDNNCSVKQAINFVKSIKDKRIIIENMPYGDRICTTPKETKEFLKQTNKGFCLDINHAIETATFLKLDYIKFLKDFIKLKPVHYHIGGQTLGKKTHLALIESDFNIKKVISLLPKDTEITLEVSLDIKKTEKDIILIKKIIDELKK